MNKLIDKFFAGETTCAEEKELFSRFANGCHIDESFVEMREMMQWYASLSDTSNAVVAIRHRRSLSERIVHWVSAAAVVAIVGLVSATFVERQASDERLMAQYAGSYVVKDGVRFTDVESIYPQLRHAELMVEANEREAERRISEHIEAASRGIGDYIESDNPAVRQQVEALFTD